MKESTAANYQPVLEICLNVESCTTDKLYNLRTSKQMIRVIAKFEKQYGVEVVVNVIPEEQT